MKNFNILFVEGNLKEENQNFLKVGIQTHTESLKDSLNGFDNHYNFDVINFITNNYDINTYIFDESIDDDEYISIIEFSHFISFYKCLSIIMEFTGIKRLAYLKEDNITEYLYITPSDCIIDTKNLLLISN